MQHHVEKTLFFGPSVVVSNMTLVLPTVVNGKFLSEWDENDVCQWLSELNFDEEVQTTFRTNLLVGADLVELTLDELKSELGIGALGSRKLILRAAAHAAKHEREANQQVVVEESPRVDKSQTTEEEQPQYTPSLLQQYDPVGFTPRSQELPKTIDIADGLQQELAKDPPEDEPESNSYESENEDVDFKNFETAELSSQTDGGQPNAPTKPSEAFDPDSKTSSRRKSPKRNSMKHCRLPASPPPPLPRKSKACEQEKPTEIPDQKEVPVVQAKPISKLERTRSAHSNRKLRHVLGVDSGLPATQVNICLVEQLLLYLYERDGISELSSLKTNFLI